MSSYQTSQFNEPYLADISGNIFETAPSVQTFHSMLDKTLFDSDTFYILLGGDCGLLMPHIIKSNPPIDSRYLIIDFDEISNRLPINSPPPENKQSIKFSTPEQWQEIADVMNLASYAYRDKVKIISSLSVQQGPNQEYRQSFQQLNKLIEQSLWRYKIGLQEQFFMNRQLENAGENIVPAKYLRNTFPDKTAIILAGGPSLDELIPWIKQHQSELLIIAVSRISAKLIKAALIPDIVISIDPQEVSFLNSKEMLELGEKTLLVNSSFLSPLLLSQWCGQNVYLGPQLPWQPEKESDNIKSVGPSVTNCAINLAIEMGCKQLILAGVDLCYSQEGYTHTSGTQEHAAGPIIGINELQVVTNDNKTAATTNTLYEAIDSVKLQSIEATSYGCKIINPAKGAAKIENVDHIPINSLEITIPLTTPAWAIIQQALPQDIDKTTRIEHYQKTNSELHHTLIALGKVKKLNQDALSHSQELSQTNTTGKAGKLEHKIERIEKKLNKEFKNLCDTLKRYNANQFSEMLKAHNEDESSQFHILKIYHQAHIEASNKLSSSIKSAQKRLLIRLEEENDHPNFEQILEQWNKDKQWGKSIKWIKQHPDTYNKLSTDQKEQLNRQKEHFITSIKAIDKDQSMRFSTSNVTSYNSILDKALDYFEKRDIDNIALLINRIEKRDPNEVELEYEELSKIAPDVLDASPLAKQFWNGYKTGDQPYSVCVKVILKGLLSELNNDQNKALQFYQKVDLKPHAWHPSQTYLERILCISLEQENYELALETLEKLSTYMDEYKIPYAQLLKATGDLNKAVDIYTSHITQNPHDLDVSLELGLIFAEIGVKDGVEAVINQIRSQSPDHPGIKILSESLEKLEAH